MAIPSLTRLIASAAAGIAGLFALADGSPVLAQNGLAAQYCPAVPGARRLS